MPRGFTARSWMLSLALIALPGPAAHDRSLAGRLAFLRDGRIWVSDLGATHLTPVVDDRSKIASFAFSPGLTHVAYARIVGDRGEDGATDRDICQTVVYDLGRRTIVAELKASAGLGEGADGSIRPEAWVSDSSLVVSLGSGWDVYGWEEFDLRIGVRRPWPLEMSDGWMASDSSFFFTTDSGLGTGFRETLHEKLLTRGTVKDLVSKRSLLAPVLSADRSRIAYVEVDWPARQDRIWVYDRRSGSEQRVFAGPAGGKSGGACSGLATAASWPPATRIVRAWSSTRSSPSGTRSSRGGSPPGSEATTSWSAAVTSSGSSTSTRSARRS